MDGRLLKHLLIALMQELSARDLKAIAKANKLQSSGNKMRVAQTIFNAGKGYAVTAKHAKNKLEFNITLTLQNVKS